jgi:hypothetical protein
MRGIPLTLKKIWFNEWEKMLESYQGYSSLELKNMPTDLNDEGLYYFRATQAASFALNRALVASIQLGTPLVTDNQYFQDAISQKIKNIHKFINESENRNEIMNYVNDLKISVARFGKIESERLINLILQNIIDDEALQKISIEKLLAYKKKSNLERESMLASVYQWAYEIEELIEAGKNDVEYISEKIYRTKVLPEVNKYREALRKLDRRLVPTILGSTAEGLGISLTATTISSLLAGLKLEQALILGIAIAAPSIGKSIKQILDFRVDRTEKQVESPLAYLLGVK